MKERAVEIRRITQKRPDVFLLTVRSAALANQARPGQFLHVKTDECTTILRRPLSIHRREKQDLSLLVKVRGRGTRALLRRAPGERLNVIGPLGNGFTLSPFPDEGTTMLIAGGIGVAPLVFLAQRLTATAKRPGTGRKIALIGARTRGEVLCAPEFRRRGFTVKKATEDGSAGRKGSVIELVRDVFAARGDAGPLRIFACGPEQMFFHLRAAIDELCPEPARVRCQVSFEQFMGCGVGVCCACAIPTRQGYKKVCKDGPVFSLHELKERSTQ